MYVSYRLALGQVLAIVLMISMSIFAPSALQAKSGECQHGKDCPGSVVRQKPSAPACGCPTAVLREKPSLPPAQTCCPVDPKDVKKAQREADHAQHEAAEACKRQQAAVNKQQQKLDAAAAKANDNIDKANAKLEKRDAENADAQAKLESFGTQSNEGVAQATPPSEDIMRSKPEAIAPPIAEAPAPAPMPPAPQIEEQKPTPAPAVETPSISESQTSSETPKELPKTASPMELIGLIGLISFSARYARRYRRR